MKITSNTSLPAFLICALLSFSCARLRSIPATSSSNPALASLANEDQADQRGVAVPHTNQERVQLVFVELANHRVLTPEDEFRAALVLDHSPMTIRNNQVAAISPNDYLLGHYLAQRAFERGYAPAGLLSAQTIDRFLSMTQGYQKYGTNRFINQVTGREELAPIDRTVTDEERAKYGVPPLAELLRRYPEAPRRTP
jgi:hypothetical protein